MVILKRMSPKINLDICQLQGKCTRGNGEMVEEPIERHGAPSGWNGTGNVSVIMSYNEEYNGLAAADYSRFYVAIKGYGSTLYQNISGLIIGLKQYYLLGFYPQWLC